MPSTRIRLVVLAMAGAGSTSVAAEIRRRLAGIGLDAPLVFESDLLATYFSGTHRPDGYAVIAGTGAGAIRVEDGRQVAVADALGWLLGDEGSGFWIGQRVVRAALADLDGRGPSTALTPLLLARLGVPAPSDAGDREPIMAVVRALYAGPPVRLADYAGLVFEVNGDETADRILDDAAAALARTLAAVRSPHRLGSRGARRRHPGARRSGRRSARRLVWRGRRSMPWPMGPSASPSSPSATPGRTSTRPCSNR